MIDFGLYVVLGFVSVALAVFGGHVSSSNRNQRLVFYVMGFISVVLILASGYRNVETQGRAEDAQRKLSDSINTVGATSNQIAALSRDSTKLQQLNTALQKQIIASNAALANVVGDIKNDQTGGESFCVFQISFAHPNGPARLTVVSYGKHPMRSVTATITSLHDDGKKYLFQPIPLWSDGTVLPGIHLLNFPIEPGKYQLNIYAANGNYDHTLHVNRAPGGWTFEVGEVWRNGKKLWPPKSR